MRRSLALVALAFTATAAQAQSTARPLPAVSLGSPALGLGAAKAFHPTLSGAPLKASLSEASAPSAPRAAALPASYKPAKDGVLDGALPRVGVPGATVPPAEAQVTDLGSLEVFLNARGSADLRDTSGALEVQRGGFRALIGQQRGADSSWALSLANESSFYRFTGPAGLVPGENKPFNDLYETRVGVQLASRASERLAWIGGVEVTMAGEDLVDPTDSLLIGGLGGVQYSLDEEVDFTFGLAGESRLEDDAWVVPFFGFDWRPTSSTRFKIHGSELRIEQALSERWTVHAGAVYDVRQYRLNEENPVSGGVFRDEEIRATVGLDWQASKAGRLSVEVGQVMWNELAVLDSSGGQVGISEAEKAPYIGFALTFGM